MAEMPVVAYTPSEEQELIRDTARQFLAERLGLEKVRELMMSDRGFDPILWKEMAELGWTGLAIPEEHGGAGLGAPELGVLLEEMGRMVTPGPYFASAVLATMTIRELGTPAQQARLLPDLAAGEKIAALAIFEEARGWAPDEPATRARHTGGRWVLEGGKRSVLSGGVADLLLVVAATEDGPGVFLLSADTGGVEVTAEPVLDPTRRQASVTFHSAPVEERLGEGDSLAGLRWALSLGSIALAAEQVGGAQACLEMSVDHAKARYQFGRPIGSYQSIKHRCANMLMKVEHAKSAAYHALRVTDDGHELAIAAPLAASVASEAYVWVAGETIQVHGGIGFTWEHDAHIYLKRAKASSLLLGDARYHRDLLGRAIGI